MNLFELVFTCYLKCSTVLWRTLFSDSPYLSFKLPNRLVKGNCSQIVFIWGLKHLSCDKYCFQISQYLSKISRIRFSQSLTGLRENKLQRIIKRSLMISKILWDFKTTQTSAPIGFKETFRSVSNSGSGNLSKNALAIT